MTIDEAIECERNHRLLPEYHEQLAEWLEELKAYKKNSNTCPRCDTYCSYLAEEFENGYNNAIDEFVNFAKSLPVVEEEDGTIRPMWLEEMAEKLKAGGENGADNQ